MSITDKPARMMMIVGSQPPTEPHLATGRMLLEIREQLLARDEIKAHLDHLAHLARTGGDLRHDVVALSEALDGHLTAHEIEQHVAWQVQHPGEVLLVSFVAETHDSERARARVRSGETVRLVVDSLCHKAAGARAGEADEAVGDGVEGAPRTPQAIAVFRKRLRDDARRVPSV